MKPVHHINKIRVNTGISLIDKYQLPLNIITDISVNGRNHMQPTCLTTIQVKTPIIIDYVCATIYWIDNYRYASVFADKLWQTEIVLRNCFNILIYSSILFISRLIIFIISTLMEYMAYRNHLINGMHATPYPSGTCTSGQSEQLAIR